MGPTLTAHVKSSDLISIFLKKPLTETLLFHYEAARYDAHSLTIHAPRFGHAIRYPETLYNISALESILPSGADSLSP